MTSTECGQTKKNNFDILNRQRGWIYDRRSVHNEFLVHVLNIKMVQIFRFKDKIGD